MLMIPQAYDITGSKTPHHLSNFVNVSKADPFLCKRVLGIIAIILSGTPNLKFLPEHSYIYKNAKDILTVSNFNVCRFKSIAPKLLEPLAIWLIL